MTTNNGGSSTGEQELSEPLPTETLLSLFNITEETGTKITTLVLLELTEKKLSKRSDGSMVTTEISEIWV
jgi:hypothetical protein